MKSDIKPVEFGGRFGSDCTNENKLGIVDVLFAKGPD